MTIGTGDACAEPIGPGPMISIVLPTRNGRRYLPWAIDSVLSQEGGDFELIVSDNHSEDGTLDYLQSIDDQRLRVIQPPRLVSMVEHFEFAIAAARGTWVTSLGDDDGLMPFFFRNLRALDLDAVDAECIVFRRAYYFWEGCDELHGNNVVIFYPAYGEFYKNNKWSLFLCLASVFDYMHLPQLYTTGLVKRRYIERIKQATGGVFFHGKAPDASSVVALMLNSARHLRVEEPIFWTGTSPKSTGFSQMSTQHKFRSDEFDLLHQRDRPADKSVLPAALSAKMDFTVLLYETLLQHPAAKWYWRSWVVRSFFQAGLILKDSENLDRLQQSYKGFRVWKVRPFMAAIQHLRRRHDQAVKSLYMLDATLAVHSDDRARFPTMTEASEAVTNSWARMHAAEESER